MLKSSSASSGILKALRPKKQIQIIDAHPDNAGDIHWPVDQKGRPSEFTEPPNVRFTPQMYWGTSIAIQTADPSSVKIKYKAFYYPYDCRLESLYSSTLHLFTSSSPSLLAAVEIVAISISSRMPIKRTPLPPATLYPTAAVYTERTTYPITIMIGRS